jgi:hypothetical protein
MRGPARGIALLLACLVAVVACDEPGRIPDGSPQESLGPSGIRGRVLIGPTCARPAAAATPCVEPYVARLLILDRDGEVAAEVTSGADGRYEARLPPGTYVVAPVPGGDPFPNARAQTVSVDEGEFAIVDVEYDTGAR